MSYSLSLDKFVGKVAVVTGASSGIGKAVAETLVKQGVIVAAIARRLERLQECSNKLRGEKGKLHPFQCDLTDQHQILSTFNKIIKDLGPIYILVNNAGLAQGTNIIDGDVAKYKAVLDTNVLAAAICIKESVSSMKAHHIKGHIININSVVGHVVIDYPNSGLYAASKFALRALSETVRLEINREKLPIKITNLSPGYVKTEFIETAFGKEAAASIPEDYGLESVDIADAVLYVLSTPDHVNVKELTVSVVGHIA